MNFTYCIQPYLHLHGQGKKPPCLSAGQIDRDAMVGGMYRWAFSRHDAAHSVPPGRKHISLVAMPHAFQGWDEKTPTKSQDKFCVALRGHFQIWSISVHTSLL